MSVCGECLLRCGLVPKIGRKTYERVGIIIEIAGGSETNAEINKYSQKNITSLNRLLIDIDTKTVSFVTLGVVCEL